MSTTAAIVTLALIGVGVVCWLYNDDPDAFWAMLWLLAGLGLLAALIWGISAATS